MTNQEIQEFEELEKKLSQDTMLLRYLELYILDNLENIKTRVILENADPNREVMKLEGIGELRKKLSEEPEKKERKYD